MGKKIFQNMGHHLCSRQVLQKSLHPVGFSSQIDLEVLGEKVDLFFCRANHMNDMNDTIHTRVSMEVIVTIVIVSWFRTHLFTGRIQPT